MLFASSHVAKVRALTAGCRSENLLLPWHSWRVQDAHRRAAPGAVQAAFSCRGVPGMVREEALTTAIGAPVVPEHLLQVLLPHGVSAGSWGEMPCGFRNWDRRSGIAQSNASSHRRALAGEKALRVSCIGLDSSVCWGSCTEDG